MAGKQTPSQTVGPFYALGLNAREEGYEFTNLVGPSTVVAGMAGERIRVTGHILDGEGEPVSDALVELWQADSRGRYRHPLDDGEGGVSGPAFRGFARSGTGAGEDRSFVLHTIKPGPTRDGQAPHLTLIVFMRGGLNHVYTRVYFDDEGAANASDPVLLSVPAPRRDTLVARRDETPDGVVYRFDIHMQGERETVFFDV
jgi:protocatechuate 3,4-dioxygenase alpha subunit